MTIGGEAASASEQFDVVNPATGAPFASAPHCSRRQLDEAFAAAQSAFGDWRTDIDLRRSTLHRAADAVLGEIDRLALLLTLEQGKPLPEARREVRDLATSLEFYADLEHEREVIQDDELARAELVRRPLGVVAAITPWNFPLALAGQTLGPALLTGNTVVLKPSPFTPLATLELGAILRDLLPAGVLNVISGGDELGAWMTAHPIPRKVSFTGSIATGKRVAAAAAPDLKRVTLELGGNDPAILLDDADVGAIADRLFWAAFACNGQVCAAVKRIYAHERVYDEVVEALVERARVVTVGDGTQPGTELGPVNNRPQYERFSGLVADALAGGARAAAGGRQMPGEGYFHEPTILTDLAEGATIVEQEQFGPALPILRFRDVDDAVARANASHFGLSGSVWSAEPERAMAVAEQLECGTAWINEHLVVPLSQPFGGHKWSGVGVANGVWGARAYTDTQVIRRARATG